jgi:tRNA nucleotidyltransferase/poly(A) polymerase
MKLRELLSKLIEVQESIGASKPYICGGTPRDKYMGRLDNISDLDITTGDKTVDYLSQEFSIALRQQYDVTRKPMPDGHSTIFVGNLKMDFSSNFNLPNIEEFLKGKGITNPSEMQKEMYSRDFTCNSLLLDTSLKKIMDPTERGFKDIKDKKIRTCLSPDVTLVSNKNRVVRSIYLACKLDFDLDESIIAYVQKNPNAVKVSTEKVMAEKLDEAFSKDPDKASYLLAKMNLWTFVPISEKMYPYYEKHNKGKVNAK